MLEMYQREQKNNLRDTLVTLKTIKEKDEQEAIRIQ
jgi:hypothetical protein